MRMTADLIRSAPAYINPIKERELSLRGFKISAIENLGVTQDQYQVIDLSDNEVLKIDNFPKMTRLTGILLSNNAVVRIAPGLGEFLPKLNTLMLTRNKISTLKDLLPLKDLPTITHLSLMHNPVAKTKNYRLYVIHKLPNLKALDFKKVKTKEREASYAKYGEPDWLEKKGKKAKKGEESKEDVSMEAEDEDEVADTTMAGEGQAITPAQREKIMEKIQNASSLEEIEKLEKMLKTGKISKELMAD
jgi:U2 small nuclear ribonucleoprotein A'